MPADARGLREYAILYLKGVTMGAADVVPGVSGGTMALILGIYRELIDSLGAISARETVAALSRGRLLAVWRRIGAPFLLVLAAGIGTSVLALSGAILLALTEARSLVFALFFGLILASVFTVARRVDRWGSASVAGLLLGAALGFWLVGLTPTTTPASFLFLAFSGALAICALILPGISGAFILVLLGKYDFVLGAISDLELTALLPVAIGAVVGLLAFARLLAWLLRRAPGPTLAVLSGFMLGSLRKVWPWQHGDEFSSINLPPPDTMSAVVALALALAGAIAVVVLDSLGRRRAGVDDGVRG